MDTRKVQEMGHGTVLVSLPKKWAKNNGIVGGATIAVEEISPSRILVHPIESGGNRPKEVTIEYPRESLAYVLNEITGAYLLGYEIIRISGNETITREDRERLLTVIKRLVGLEIMDEDAKSITTQFLPEPSVLDPEKMVRRMAKLTQGMLRDTRDGLMEKDRKVLSLVAERDDEVDRLYFLLVRAIRTATIDPAVAERYHLAPVECLDYRVLASFLESLGDTMAELSKRVLEELPPKEIGKRFAPIFTKLEEMEDLAIRSFLSRRMSQAHGTYLELEAMEKDVVALSSSMAQSEGISTKAMVDLLSLVERMSKIFKDISDLALPTYVFQR
jgi:phosphate uptake regulator